MEHDIFDHHDGIVDDQPYRGGETAERHEIERLPHKLERDERDHDGHGNYQARNQ